MAKNSKRLPLRCAKSFAKSKGLQQQVAWLLKKVNKPKEWSDDHFEEARKGKFIELFYTKGYWEDFKRKCWPNAESTDGQERIEKHYRPRAQGLNADLRAKGLSILWQLSEVEWGNVISPINQVPLQVSLPKEKMRQLNILARELDEEPSTLAKIWIVEHLCKLCKDGP